MIFGIIVKKIGGYYGLRTSYLKSGSKYKRKLLSFILRGYQHETNSHLPFNNIIEGPVNFLHGTYGVFISGESRIGKNATIYQQVTIGSNMLLESRNMGSPAIGDNCLIGAGAKIIGKVKIGNNCRIGANAVVTQDMQDNSIAFGNTTIITKDYCLPNKVYTKSADHWGTRENGHFVPETNPDIIAKLNSIF